MRQLSQNSRLLQAVGADALTAMGEAIRKDKLGLLAVLSPKIMEQLARCETATLTLEDGGVVILVPQGIVDQLYKQTQEWENG